MERESGGRPSLSAIPAAAAALLLSAPQEDAAISARLNGPPDVAPNWRQSGKVLGAGPAGYVYQACVRTGPQAGYGVAIAAITHLIMRPPSRS